MRSFSLSANIENGALGSEHYIVTPNAQKVANEIVNQYQSGIHSFTIIGTYGTGKSSFLLNFEQDLAGKNTPGVLVRNPKSLAAVSGYDIINIVGEYVDLEKLLFDKLCKKAQGDNVFDLLRDYCHRLKKRNQMLVLVIDEFGKVLEHAAKHDVERELYFVQQLAEFVNTPHKNALLLTALHQNFNAYASKLDASQKNEWTKVKGRFQEIVFAEPVEQLLYMAAEPMANKYPVDVKQANAIYEIARQTKFVSPALTGEVMRGLYPLDAFSAVVLTKAIQKYGQNERSLFSFLNSKGANSLSDFRSAHNRTYNLSDVYDYIINNFHSYLSDVNEDSMGWSAILVAIERIETADWQDEDIMKSALEIVKVIGMLNLFGNAGFSMPHTALASYLSLALDVNDPDSLLRELMRLRIIRFAEYKKRFILFEGTDINIEEEIARASTIVPIPLNPVDDLRVYFNNRVAPVKAYYYHFGTPRYFEYSLYDSPLDIIPVGDIDGYVELIFSSSGDSVEDVRRFSQECTHSIIFVVFNRTDSVVRHLHKIHVYDYIMEKVLIDKSDKVALREIIQLKTYEQNLLNKVVKDSLFSYNDDVTWIYKGNVVQVRNQRDFNTLLSYVCDDVYPLTPVINNELINRHKLSASISAAKVKYLQALTTGEGKENLGFEYDRFPPEKTVYYTLLKNTGLYVSGEFSESPSDEGIKSLWEACEKFLHGTQEKPRKVSELIKMLSEQPYKIKMGVLDFWIPTYLFIKRLDYSLFGGNGAYIPEINMEFFDLLKKHPSDFSIKAYAEDGVKMEFYNQYRKFINVGEKKVIKGDKFIETVKPFFFFYNHLNEYAKHTRKFDHITTLHFRDVLAKAKDPEKTFFEDLPAALGYDKASGQGEEFVASYCEIIQKAVRELRSCYRSLIDRIENQLIERLDLQEYEYSDYIIEIRQRLSHIKEYLLSDKQRDFYNHAMAEFDNRQEWYQSICYAALDQPLERLRDEQEEQLIDNIVFLFRECEKHSIVSEAMSFRVNDEERRHSQDLENKIESLLSDDMNLNIYALMNVLKRKMR